MHKYKCGWAVVRLFVEALPRRTLEAARDARRAFCGVSAVTLKQASCVASHAARPVAVPRQIGKAASRHWKSVGKEASALDVYGFPKTFQLRLGGFPIWVRRGEATRQGCRRTGLAPVRRHPGRWPASRGGATASQNRRGCASMGKVEWQTTKRIND